MEKMYDENLSSVVSLNNSIIAERSMEISLYKIILNNNQEFQSRNMKIT